MQRLQITASIFATGRVWLPESSVRKGFVKDWAEGFLSQLCSFPDATHDDYVDSCVDASTLITMADNSLKRIVDIVVGDMVLTPNGGKRVSAVHSNGLKEVWEIIAGKQKLIVTPDHRVMTSNGWCRVDSLTQTCDNVFLYQGETSCHLNLLVLSLLKRLCLTIENITVTLKVITRRTNDILQGLVVGFIGMFGNSIKAPFQMGIMSITLTGILQTMTFRIWNAFPKKNIGVNTEQKGLLLGKGPSNWPISRQSDQKRLNGINQTQVENGIESTQKKQKGLFGQSLAFILNYMGSAYGAVMNLLPRRQGKSFAEESAKFQNLHTGVVKEVNLLNITKAVYDLTVEDEHCYFANGILVHNCTQTIRFLKDAGWLDINPEPRYDDEDYVDARPKRVNPYAV
jgi:hypothetical protein